MKKIIIISCLLILIASTYIISLQITLKNDYYSTYNFLLTKFTKKKTKIDIMSFYLDILKSDKHFLDKKENQTPVISYALKKPTIYIYQTHTNEEYKENELIQVGVKTASYLLNDELQKLGLLSFVEPENTISILTKRNLLYKDSYKISRELMEKRYLENPSLEYFIDIHRDSVKKSITTATINEKKYAKVMFLLGLENKNYLENKKVITKLNDYINKNYPGLSRGIYEKKGAGVNGIYNQDFSPNCLLIEVGGYENNLEEVNNTIKVLAEVIHYSTRNN